jgi:hypothetical protein
MSQAYLDARPSGEHGFYNLPQLDQILIERDRAGGGVQWTRRLQCTAGIVQVRKEPNPEKDRR